MMPAPSSLACKYPVIVFMVMIMFIVLINTVGLLSASPLAIVFMEIQLSLSCDLSNSMVIVSGHLGSPFLL